MNDARETPSTAPDSEARLNAVLAEVIRRRDDGEVLPDDQVLASHPHLQPQLGERLRELVRIDRAERAARRRADRTSDARLAHRAPPSLVAALQSYQLEGEVFHGGQSTVYCGRNVATGRRVAIKVLRDSSLLGDAERDRFEREVRVLGSLHHPNIVTIHDSGVAGEWLYFVMDFVDGAPLDKYVESNNCPIDRIVRLFIAIADAIHTAHVRGVIHRDLKPSNIRVDAKGSPYVLDFGLAKVFGDSASQALRERVTLTHQFVGSFPWASPEQCSADPNAVDVRTDVYSLGVMLYYSVTGHFPYPVTGPIHEVLSRIVSLDPIPPRTVSKEIDADLEVILLACLDKQPSRRYASAAALAEDLQRWLARQPILARAPSTVYLIRKVFQRHRLVVVLLSAFVVALLGFSVGISVLFQRASVERSRAVAAEGLAERRRAEATQEAKTAQAVTDFLINDVLASAAPAKARGRQITVAEAFDSAAQRVSTTFVDDPLLRASVLAQVGEVYLGLGLYKDAATRLREAADLRTVHLGATNPATMETKRHLLDALVQHGAYTEADSIAHEMLTLSTNELGERHLETLQVASRVVLVDWSMGRGAQAIEDQREIYRLLQETVGDDHPATLFVLSQSAASEFLYEAPLEEVEAIFRRGLDAARRRLGEDAPETLRLKTSLGVTLMRQRRFREAEELLPMAVEECRRVLGERHLDTIMAMTYLSAFRQQQSRLREAEETCQRAYDLAIAQFGDEHWPTIFVLERLADIKSMRGYPEEALVIGRQVRALKERIREPDDLSLSSTWDQMGGALFALGRYNEAVEAHTRALTIYRASRGPDAASVGTLRGLVRSLGAAGRGEEARPFTQFLLEQRRAKSEAATTDAYTMNAYAMDLLWAEPPDLRDPATALRAAQRAYEAIPDEYAFNRFTLGLCHEALGRFEEAEYWLRRALANESLERSSWRSEMEAALVRVLIALGDTEGTEEFHRQLLSARSAQPLPDPMDVAVSLDDLGSILIEHKKYSEAEPHLQECLALRMATGEQDWRLANTKSLLGAALAGQGRFNEAEELLVQAAGELAGLTSAPLRIVEAAAERLRVLSDPR